MSAPTRKPTHPKPQRKTVDHLMSEPPLLTPEQARLLTRQAVQEWHLNPPDARALLSALADELDRRVELCLIHSSLHPFVAEFTESIRAVLAKKE